MKTPVVLLPFVGLGIAGTWWWGGSPGADPSAAEPLQPPLTSAAILPLPVPARASIDKSALTSLATESTAPIVPTTPAESGASDSSALDRGIGGPSPSIDIGAFDESVVRDGQRKKERRPERRNDVNLQLVQRLENGEPHFVLEARESELPSDGPITTSHSTGTKASEGTMRNGKRVGSWCEWYAAGQKSAQGNYFHGTKHGFWNYWYENGQVREAGEYLYGRKEGLWTSWFDNGQKERIAYYRNDRAEDRTTIWYSDGTKAAEGQLEEDLREGLWLEWHANAALASRGTYRHGNADGRWEYWHSDGVLDLGQSGLYLEGRRIGE